MLPVTTTTVTVIDQGGIGDPYEAGTATTVATGVPAHIGSPSGMESRLGGEREVVDAVLHIDVTPLLTRSYVVVDEQTDETWSITWVRTRIGLGLDHQRAGLVAVKGGAGG
jgi:hypothetical protein